MSQPEDKARIAELEAENKTLDRALDLMLEKIGKRSAELEAEVARWKAEAHRLRNVIANKNAEQDRLIFALEVIRTGETTVPKEMAAAALRTAVLAEREACAAIADRYEPHGTIPEAVDIAASIRARPAP